MLVLLSPSKKLDENSVIKTAKFTIPEFIIDAEILSSGLKKLSSGDISDLMHLSVPLSNLNFERYQQFNVPFTPQNSRQALFTFKGDVYDKMDVENYSEEDLDFAQKHIRILSGLYGMLRPLDLMQPYRLEMGTKYENERGRNLYGFWDSRITDTINKQDRTAIINLASIEYFKAVKVKNLTYPLINIVFKQRKDGKLKTIGLMAKRARGLMADYIIKNRIHNIDDIKNFDVEGYAFAPEMSAENSWVFTMDMPARKS
ncbi:MAG: cytoplasmic iron level regulating protein YaaA (DUF328/UPF0246 family) [Alphaproteobacteria bacterium]|jgi:cytoplasmic iron level regulating protein YaaA (DUF328/UPF0246 family)